MMHLCLVVRIGGSFCLWSSPVHRLRRRQLQQSNTLPGKDHKVWRRRTHTHMYINHLIITYIYIYNIISIYLEISGGSWSMQTLSILGVDATIPLLEGRAWLLLENRAGSTGRDPSLQMQWLDSAGKPELPPDSGSWWRCWGAKGA